MTEAAEELLQELEQLHFAVKEQTAALETTLQQIEHYQQVQLLHTLHDDHRQSAPSSLLILVLFDGLNSRNSW